MPTIIDRGALSVVGTGTEDLFDETCCAFVCSQENLLAMYMKIARIAVGVAETRVSQPRELGVGTSLFPASLDEYRREI